MNMRSVLAVSPRVGPSRGSVIEAGRSAATSPRLRRRRPGGWMVLRDVRLEAGRVSCAREQEALAQLTAQALQALQLPRLLDALGHDLEVKRPTQRDDRVGE